jgi:hypothetical protein
LYISAATEMLDFVLCIRHGVLANPVADHL